MRLNERPPVGRPPGSREFSDGLLQRLRRGGYRPGAWRDLLAAALQRSAAEAAARPVAAAQVLAIWTGALTVGGPPARSSAAGFLALTHLGLLGQRRSLGLANAMTMLRASLPATPGGAVFAAVLDGADGIVARHAGPTAFGAFADPLADLAFWSALAARPDAGRVARVITALLWGVPAAVITAANFAGGKTVDYPRRLLVRRVSAVTQAFLVAASLRRSVAGRHTL